MIILLAASDSAMSGAWMKLVRSGAVSAFAMTLLFGLSAHAAPLNVGETAQFGMDDMDRIGFVNGVLNKHLREPQMAGGGTVKKLAAKKFLVCGFYNSLADQSSDAAPKAFAILTDGTAKNAKAYAPLTPVQMEAHGCFAGERDHDAAIINRLLRETPK